MQKTNLYFIALIPHQELREQVKQMKEEILANFKAKHALKSPAHITLQMPFKREPEFEPTIIRKLNQFASQQSPFTVEISDFGCFTTRVIYLKIKNHEPIVQLFTALQQMLEKELGFKPDEHSTKIHPHMTLATRDLEAIEFQKAWSEFETNSFSASFDAKSIFLLKHNGKYWDIHTEFVFGK